MKKEQFELMLSLQDTLRDEANALFREYRKMRQQTIGPKELERPTSMDSYDYYYEPTDFEDDLPPLPIREEWEEEFDPQPKPTLLERMMEHSKLRFKCYYGYECEYGTCELPLRWLFNEQWRDEAQQMLDQEAEKLKARADADREYWRQRDLTELKRLQEKYATNA